MSPSSETPTIRLSEDQQKALLEHVANSELVDVARIAIARMEAAESRLEAAIRAERDRCLRIVLAAGQGPKRTCAQFLKDAVNAIRGRP